MDNESISQICISAFTEDEIQVAKSLLFESVPTSRRNIKRKRAGKALRDIDDILCLLKESDPKSIPIFVARDLQKLPPVTFDHVDVTKLLKDLLLVQREIKLVKEQYVTTQEIESIKTELENFKRSTVDMPGVNSNYIFNNTNHSKSSSYDTVLSVPTSPSMQSFSMESTFQTQVDADSKKNRKPIANTMHASSNERAMIHHTLTPAAESGRKSDLRHTAIPNEDQVGTIQTFADVMKNGLQAPMMEHDGWILVEKKKRFRGFKGKAATNQNEKFKAANIKIPIYIYNVDKAVSPEDILAYIKEKSHLEVSVERMAMKRAKEYNSYKIFVPKENENIFMNEEFWPDGVSFRRFIRFTGIRRDSEETRNTYKPNHG
uniref:Mutant cadherin n=1 Tax=Heliothis virescens TaxID=7102 RepID=A0A2A4JSC0_HELVI